MGDLGGISDETRESSFEVQAPDSYGTTKLEAGQPAAAQVLAHAPLGTQQYHSSLANSHQVWWVAAQASNLLGRIMCVSSHCVREEPKAFRPSELPTDSIIGR